MFYGGPEVQLQCLFFGWGFNFGTFRLFTNHDVEKNITKKRFGKGNATLQGTKISHLMEQRKKSSTQKWGVFFWLWWDMLVSMRIRVLPKGWFPKATWQKPRGCFQATNLFFRPPSRIRNWLNWGARKKMMAVRGCRWLCFFFFVFSFLKKHQPSWKDEM